MQIANKCLLCSHYTDENLMVEYKIGDCVAITGVLSNLISCSKLSYKEE